MKHLKLLLLFTLLSAFAYGQTTPTLPSGSIQVQTYKNPNGKNYVGNAAKQFEIIALQRSVDSLNSNNLHKSGYSYEKKTGNLTIDGLNTVTGGLRVLERSIFGVPPTPSDSATMFMSIKAPPSYPYTYVYIEAPNNGLHYRIDHDGVNGTTGTDGDWIASAEKEISFQTYDIPTLSYKERARMYHDGALSINGFFRLNGQKFITEPSFSGISGYSTFIGKSKDPISDAKFSITDTTRLTFQGFHGIADYSVIKQTTNGSNYSALHARPTLDSAGNWGILSGLESSPIYNGSDSLTNLNGVLAFVKHTGTGKIAKASGVTIGTNQGSGNIETLYGINIESQTGGNVNFALNTGAGLVNFGDNVTAANNLSNNGNLSWGMSGNKYMFGYAGTQKFGYTGSNENALYSGGATGLNFYNAADDTILMNLSDNGSLSVNGSTTSSKYNLSALNTAPLSSTDTGTAGEIRVTASFIYVCTATNTWVRAALTTW